MAEKEPSLLSPIDAEFPPMSPSEKETAFSVLKELAQEGIVADSDLDGLMGVWLLKEAGVIPADFDGIYYPSHEELKKNEEAYRRFRALSPAERRKARKNGGFPDFFYRNAGLMVDISPEEIEGIPTESREDGRPQRPQRDSLVSSIRIKGKGKRAKIIGRQMYFDHHGPDSTGTSGSSTRKIYRWLLALDKLPAPDTEAGRRILNIVHFVDAHDNKTYHTDDFGPEQLKLTARNAFGLAYAKEQGKTLMSWQKAANSESRLPNPVMIELMALTGGDPTIQLSDDQLREAGIEDPAGLVRTTNQAIEKGLSFMRQWVRRPGRTTATADGNKVVIDIRSGNSPENLNQRLAGVDVGDVSTALGFDTHLIYGGTTITIFTHHESVRQRLMDLEQKFGGTFTRNIYVYNRTHKEAGRSAPTLEQLKETLSAGDSEQPATAETVPIADNIRQTMDKSCVLAALRNLETFAFGFSKPDSEGDLIAAATAEGIIDEHKGILRTTAREFLKKIGFAVSTREKLEDILTDLRSGRGLIMFRDRHAVAIYYDTLRNSLVVRDPEKETPEFYDASAEILAQIAGVASVSKINGAKVSPYGHLWIVSTPEMNKVITARSETEQQYAEKHKASPEQRLAWIWKTYRPKMELPDSIKSIRLLGRETGIPTPRHGLELLYNQRLEEAFRWELAKHGQIMAAMDHETAHRYLDKIEARYVAEAIVVSEQFQSVKADDELYKQKIAEQLTSWEDIRKSYTYTTEQEEEADGAINTLKNIQNALEKGGQIINFPKAPRAGSEKRMAKQPTPWAELHELEVQYYLLNPTALTGDPRESGIDQLGEVGLESTLVASRLKSLGQMLGARPDETTEMMLAKVARLYPDLSEDSKAANKLLRGYTVLASRLLDMQTTKVDSATIRKFLSFQEEQSTAYFATLNSLIGLEWKILGREGEETQGQLKPKAA